MTDGRTDGLTDLHRPPPTRVRSREILRSGGWTDLCEREVVEAEGSEVRRGILLLPPK